MKKQDAEVWQIQVIDAKSAAGKPITVEAFLIAKLGNSAGKSLFKELVAAAKDAITSASGNPAILLSSKGGAFVNLSEAS
jgi:hypothetical protein